MSHLRSESFTPFGPSYDQSSSWQLDCNFMRNPKPEPRPQLSHSQIPGPQRLCKTVNVYCGFKPLVCYAAKMTQMSISEMTLSRQKEVQSSTPLSTLILCLMDKGPGIPELLAYLSTHISDFPTSNPWIQKWKWWWPRNHSTHTLSDQGQWSPKAGWMTSRRNNVQVHWAMC